MQVLRGIHPGLLPASVVTLGMFDGVHRGHQALLGACRRQADRLGLPAVALTYEPHPTQVLRPDTPVRLLTPLPEKLERLEQATMDYTVVVDFTHAFSQLTPDAFLRDVVVASLHPQVVVVGYRTTFGHDRTGSAAVLRTLAATLGFTAEVIEPVEVAGGPASSSRIRACLDAGNVVLAEQLLGYRYRLSGFVMRGDGRGQRLGVATANLDVAPDKLVPADGVYVVDADAPSVSRRAVMNIGNRPTFGRPRSLEAHLLEYQGDLYGQPLSISFLARLRDIQSFPDTQALLTQIHDDIAQAKRF